MIENCDLTSTPIVDKLIELTKKDILSFHALPISGKRSISGSVFYEKYKALFGEDYYKSELTVTGEAFDTPIIPTRYVKQSEVLTSKAFGAKHSYYVTMGTTTANRIVINSLAESNAKALVDKSCHISVHFGLRERKCDIKYVEPYCLCKDSGRSHFNLYELVDEYKKANSEGRPFSLVVINGCSYEGVFYDLKSVIRECIQINDDVSFLIDEAWIAFGYFHENYKRYMAMYIAKELQAEMPDKNIRIISTQSAHKSLSAFRQGSYIHVFGDSHTDQKIKENKFFIHTMSPSYPIIASLELARAQAAAEGRLLICEALQHAKYFCHQITENIKLSDYEINDTAFIDNQHKNVVFVDPLKISISLSKLNISPKEFIKFSFNKFGIYINRYYNSSILININIGIKKEDIMALLNMMAEFQQAVRKNKITTYPENSRSEKKEHNYLVELGHISEDFVIPYPPGVPILFKGDTIDKDIVEKINRLEENGIDLIIVK